MALTVYSEGLGLFHKGSPGKGIAPADVCLSPPPPPTGPVPVPYVNTLSASDLAKGSKSVTVDGNPTALEDQSYVSTSSGDEAGTQGGNVVTHKTKGKGYFKIWSFTVQIEGKGICRHGDGMGQNCASDPPGCVDMKALVSFLLKEEVEIKPCSKPYDRKALGLEETTPEQKDSVRGGPCWECNRDLPSGNWESITLASGAVKAKMSAYTSGLADNKQFIPDHQPPLNIAWSIGGCHMKPSPDAFKEWANSTQAVKPHCKTHSSSQGGTLRPLTSGKGAADALNAVLGIIPK